MPNIPNQVLLRVVDDKGDLHVIHRGTPGFLKNGWPYIMEGHFGQPASWRKAMPSYFMPITQDEVAAEYQKQGKQWFAENENWEG